jgi:hypothetical protein
VKISSGTLGSFPWLFYTETLNKSNTTVVDPLQETETKSIGVISPWFIVKQFITSILDFTMVVIWYWKRSQTTGILKTRHGWVCFGVDLTGFWKK